MDTTKAQAAFHDASLAAFAWTQTHQKATYVILGIVVVFTLGYCAGH